MATKQDNRTWGHMTMLMVKQIGKNGEKTLHKLGGRRGGGVAMELDCEKREGCMKKEV